MSTKNAAYLCGTCGASYAQASALARVAEPDSHSDVRGGWVRFACPKDGGTVRLGAPPKAAVAA
jgi:hypothetical protein